MLINVDDEQNIKVEKLLDEGISTFKTTFNSEININNNFLNTNKNNIFQYNNKLYSLKGNHTISSYNKHKYITYNVQNTELINDTISALNTGLVYLPKYENEEFKTNTVKSHNNKRKIACLSRKAPKNSRTRNNLISKNNKNKKLNIKKKLINDKNHKENVNNNINRKNKYYTIERHSDINHSSIIQNISTNDNTNHKNSIYAILDKKDKKVNLKKNLFRNKTFNKLKNKRAKSKDFKWKEKYENIDALCNKTMKQISNLKNDNNYIKFRIDSIKNKSNNIKRIKNKSKQKRNYVDKLNNKNEYNNDTIIKQKNLIEKISKEIDYLKRLI